MRTPCPNQYEGCPEPFADLHHIYKEADADTYLKRFYCRLGSNTMQLCRCIHRELEAQDGWLPYPEPDVMLDTIAAEAEVGNVFVSVMAHKRLGI